MMVPVGTTNLVVPSDAATAQPVDASLTETVSGVLLGLVNSTYSSVAPFGPLTRNSLMINVGGVPPSGKTVTLKLQVAPPAPVTFSPVVPTGKVEPEGMLNPSIPHEPITPADG